MLFCHGIFQPQFRAAISFWLELCWRCKCCSRGRRDRWQERDGGEGKETGSWRFLPNSSPLPASSEQVQDQTLIKDAAPSGLHGAQAPQWELLSTGQGWKTVVSWRHFADRWALAKNLTWVVTTEQQFWKLVPCDSEMLNIYQHQSASA